VKQLKRYEDPDSDWSDPGSTFGIADRWTTRRLNGLWLTAGHNARNGPHYTDFVVPESKSPWKVYALAPHQSVLEQWTMTLVASGTALSVALARHAAEDAARALEIP
jgi:hypothetical protein